MKIAINKCYGGFGLSDEALEKLIEYGVPYFKSYKEVQNKDGLYIYDAGSSFGKYFTNLDYYENRTNELMIKVIEEIGEAKASGRFASIEIVSVPDDVEWFIDDYDGIESIHEKHRNW